VDNRGLELYKRLREELSEEEMGLGLSVLGTLMLEGVMGLRFSKELWMKTMLEMWEEYERRVERVDEDI